MSKDNDVLNAMLTQIKAYFTANSVTYGAPLIDRNIDFPADIPADGLIIIRDGDPGPPDICCGQPGPAIYEHHVEIDIAVQAGTDPERDADYALLKSGLGNAIEVDKFFGGAANGCWYGNPKPRTEPIDGASGVKEATVILIVSYTAPTPLT